MEKAGSVCSSLLSSGLWVWQVKTVESLRMGGGKKGINNVGENLQCHQILLQTLVPGLGVVTRCLCTWLYKNADFKPIPVAATGSSVPSKSLLGPKMQILNPFWAL